MEKRDTGLSTHLQTLIERDEEEEEQRSGSSSSPSREEGEDYSVQVTDPPLALSITLTHSQQDLSNAAVSVTEALRSLLGIFAFSTASLDDSDDGNSSVYIEVLARDGGGGERLDLSSLRTTRSSSGALKLD